MNEEEIYFLTSEDIIGLHCEFIERFGGFAGVRDYDLLDSALAQPQMNVYGAALNPTIYDKAAAYLYFLVCNHTFNDGNKRVGLHACLLFLEINGIMFSKDQDVWYEFTLSVANGNETKESCSNFIYEHCFEVNEG